MRRDLYEPDHDAFREVVQAYVKREVTGTPWNPGSSAS
jgi:hypothetical protein